MAPPTDALAADAPTTTPFPTAPLRAIATAAGVAVDDLAVLEANSRSALFGAALDYAARHPRRGGAGGAKAPPRALWSNPSDSCEWSPNADSNSDDMDAGDVAADDDDAYLAMRESSRVLDDGRRSRSFKVVAGAGVTVVTWPPPPEASVEAVRASLKEQAAAGTKGATPNSGAADGSVAPAAIADAAPADPVADGLPAPDGVATVHIVHYTVGPPMADSCGGATLYRAVALVSTAADGEAALVAFARGVLAWRAAVYVPEPTPAFFELHRFKTDADASEGHWEFEGEKRGRLLSSVILPNGVVSSMVADVRAFLSPMTRSWYRRHGLPYRRSYLFHGTPGSGKTSIIRGLASSFGLSACYLSMTNGRFNNQVLMDALETLPSKALLVIEDVDALFGAHRSATRAAGALTFSGLLNCLDGLTAAESVLVAMTTNKGVDELDPALIRGGRVDRRWAFRAPTAGQLARLFGTYYPDAGAATGASFAAALMDGLGAEAVSMAAAQQLFIRARTASAAEAVAAVPAFCEEYLTGRAEDAAEAAVAAAAAAEAGAVEGDGGGEDGSGGDDDGDGMAGESTDGGE